MQWNQAPEPVFSLLSERGSLSPGAVARAGHQGELETVPCSWPGAESLHLPQGTRRPPRGAASRIQPRRPRERGR